MDLGPKNPNNEFVKNGLVNWALGNQTNLQMELDVERMKKKMVCVGINRPRQDPRRSVLIYCFSVYIQIFILTFQCFFLLFIPSFTFIPTSHLYTGGLVLILIPSAPSISLHVVAIRLKHAVQVSLPH